MKWVWITPNLSFMTVSDPSYSAVILAAGHSSRMGVPKMFLEVSPGVSFLDACVDAFIGFGCKEVLVVTNPSFMMLVDLKPSWEGIVRLVQNAKPDYGRFYSLQCGLKALIGMRSVFFHNVDNPFVSKEVLTALSSKEGEASVVRPSFNKQRGHPVLINSNVVKDMLSEKGHVQDLRDYLARYKNVSVPVKTPDILKNINTPEDYRKIIQSS